MLCLPSENVILQWMSFTGVTPTWSSKTEKFENSRRYGFWVTVHLTSFAAFLCIFSVETNSVALAVELLQGVINTFNIITTTVILWKVKFDELHGIFVTFKSIDCELNVEPGARKFAGAIFVAANLAMIVPSVVLLVLMDSNHFVCTAITVSLYYTHLQGILQVYILDQVYLRFAILLDKICVMDVDKASQVHGHLLSITNSFNNLFGWNIFFGFMAYLLSLIEEVYLLCSGYVSQYPSLLIWSLPQCICIILHITWIANKAESLLTQNNDLLEKVSSTLSLSKDEEQKGKLVALKQDILHRRPMVTAAGFFEVNHAMLFMMFNMIVTDLIAVAQFDFTKYEMHVNSTQS